MFHELIAACARLDERHGRRSGPSAAVSAPPNVRETIASRRMLEHYSHIGRCELCG